MQIHKDFLIVIILLACLCAYFNTFFAYFVWDDNIFIVHNPYMHSLKFLPKFFFQDFWKVGVQTLSSGYYRPLLAASFILDYTLWGNNAFGFHLTNLIFHSLASILVFILLEALLQERMVAFCSALLFSVHPIHTESVSFISGRVDLLPLAFCLASLILFLKYASDKKFIFYAVSLFSFFVALLTKEMAVTLPFLVLVMDYLFISKTRIRGVIKNIPGIHLGFFAVLGVYLVMRFFALGRLLNMGSVHYAANFLPGSSPHWQFFTVIKVLALYIRLLFFPYGLKVDYFFPAANSLFEPVVLSGIVVLSFFIWVAIKNIRDIPALTFAASWFFITIFPVSNIIPVGNIFTERYLYIPSVGFCIAIGYIFVWAYRKDVKTNLLNWKKSVVLLFLLLAVALGRLTYERNKIWNNEFFLWLETAKVSPNSPRAHLNLAAAYNILDKTDDAIREVGISLKIYPGYAKAYETLGRIFSKKGYTDEAIAMYKKAISISPNDTAGAYSGLVVSYGRKGLYKESIAAAIAALKINPYSDNTRYNLALSCSKAGLIEEAIKTYQEYLKSNPDSFQAHTELGRLYYKKNDYQKAKEHLSAALKISKDYLPAKNILKLLKD